MEQVTNLKEQELDDIMDQAQNYTKFRRDLPVLVRPPEEREDDIPEGLRCSVSPPPPTRSSHRRRRDEEEDDDEWVPSCRRRLT